jgi:nicotinamidase-related amidase
MTASGEELRLTEVHLDPSRTALLVIDLQRQFTEPGRPLFVTGAPGICDRASAFASECRHAGALVVWVQQSLRPQLGGGRTSRRFGVGDIHRGDGTVLDDRLSIDASVDIVLPKWRQSSFFATDLDVILRARGIDAVLVAGVTTNVCVLAAAKDASERDYAAHVVADLTGALPVRQDGRDVLSAAEVQAASLALAQHAYGDVTASHLVRWTAPSAPLDTGGRP